MIAQLEDLEDLDICYNCVNIVENTATTGYCKYYQKSVHYTDEMCEEGAFE